MKKYLDQTGLTKALKGINARYAVKSGVTAGTYRSVTVNADGVVTAGTNPTTLAGYGITDAKIASGVITLGSSTITPVTGLEYANGEIKYAQGTNNSTLLVNTSTLKSAMSLNNVTNDAQVKRSEMGVANGVATLDSAGRVPSSQLPSYVDDVIEGYLYGSDFHRPMVSGELNDHATADDFNDTNKVTPEKDKIYVDLTSSRTYRWSGSAYAEISASLALGETSSTAYRGDRGKTAYDHATDSSRLTTTTASGLYKVAATAQGHIASLTAVTKADITALGIPGADTHYTVTAVLGASASATSDTNSQSDPYLVLLENSAASTAVQFKGGNGTTVTSSISSGGAKIINISTDLSAYAKLSESTQEISANIFKAVTKTVNGTDTEGLVITPRIRKGQNTKDIKVPSLTSNATNGQYNLAYTDEATNAESPGLISELSDTEILAAFTDAGITLTSADIN